MRNNNSGYTLLESMVALVLFLMVVVPLIARMSNGVSLNRGEDIIIAASLLEQESMRLKTFPDDQFLTKTRIVNNQEWKIKAVVTGSALKTITLTAFKRNKEIETIRFYRFDGGTSP